MLADAGVVDAGGSGLLVLLDALTKTVTGHAPHRHEYVPRPARRRQHRRRARSAAFEVMYLLSGCEPDGVEHAPSTARRTGRFGRHRRVGVRGRRRYSVHVHADDAGGAVEAALPFGTPSRIQITSLTGARQRTRRAAGPASGRCWPSSTVTARPSCSPARAPTSCGPTGDRPDVPVSAKQLLRALVDAGAAQIMVLPNGYVAAEELVAGCTAAIGWGIDVVPVPAGSMVQGLAALAVHDAEPAGRRRRLHHGPRRRGRPARLGAASPPRRR